MIAVQCNLRSYSCSESSFEWGSSVSFSLSLFISSCFDSAASCHSQHSPGSSHPHWSLELLTAAFYLPADRSLCCNLAVKSCTRQQVWQASWWHAHITADFCCVIAAFIVMWLFRWNSRPFLVGFMELFKFLQR